MNNIRTDYMNYDSKRLGPFNSLFALLVLAAVMVAMFYIFKGVYKVLYFGAPILLLITLIVNHRVVLYYFIDLFNLFRRDVLSAIVKSAFTIFCYPLVAGWLFVKAIFFYKIDQFRRDVDKQSAAYQKSLYADYEEISSKPTDPQKK